MADGLTMHALENATDCTQNNVCTANISYE